MTTVLVYESSDSIMGIAQSDYLTPGVVEEVINTINDLYYLLNEHNCMDMDVVSFIKEHLPREISFIKREDIEEMWRD